LIGVVVALIIQMVIEMACRSAASLYLPWPQVKGIVLISRMRMVCFVFNAPNYAGKMRTFSLPFRLDPAAFAAFGETARTYAPQLTVEGNIGRAMMPLTRVFLVYLALIVLIIAVVAIASAVTQSGHH